MSKPSCTPAETQPAGTIRLPVVPRRIASSRASRWRAAALILVHALIGIHFAQWWFSGRTLAPLEPSEAMQFSKEGIVNAGLIFFALMAVSTLLLGRWFCGWTCHLVGMQDLSRWILARMKIRPRPVRSRLLAVVPLLAFFYMFIGPLIYRGLYAWRGEPTPPLIASVQLMTDDFWATFPSWIPAILAVLVCCFATIYLLGAKGFCSTACPYGALFGAADQFAPLRVRVTDACKGCGHCTAACTSNVRVHEEVARYGMVVDPGCMKCLDCVSVCPNHALYVGWGAPSLFASRRDAPRGRVPLRGRVAPLLRRFSLPVLLFSFAAYAQFLGFDRGYAMNADDWTVVGVLTAVTALTLAVFAGHANRKLDYSVGEELLLGGLFLAAMYAFHGLHGLVAFLFAMALAAIIAYLLLHALLLIKRPQLSLRGWRLKHHGRLQPAAYPFLALCALVLVGAGYGAATLTGEASTRRLQHEIARLEAASYQAPLTPAMQEQLAAKYVELLERTPGDLDLVVRAGFFNTVLGRFAVARKIYDDALTHGLDDARLLTNYGVFEAARGNIAQAVPWFERALALDEALLQPRAALAQALLALERREEALRHYDIILAEAPEDVDALAGSSVALAALHQHDEALARALKAGTLAPQREDLRQWIQRLVSATSQPTP